MIKNVYHYIVRKARGNKKRPLNRGLEMGNFILKAQMAY